MMSSLPSCRLEARRAVSDGKEGETKMGKTEKNLPASDGDGGGKRCVVCARASLSWDLCGRCSRLKRSDITMLLPRRVFLTYCSGCSCYLQPPNIHVRADPNSSLLLDHCIRCFWKPPLNGFPICFVDAEFVESSDPDVIRVNLHLRGEISEGTVADRHHLIEFPVRQEICKSCSGSSISDPQRRVTRVELIWGRTSVGHEDPPSHDPNRPRHNFLVHLSSHRGIGRIGRAIRIQEHDMGTDILFPDRTHAVDCVRFFEGLFPVKKQSDDDGVSATFFSLHVLPIRPYELIRLPAAVSPGGVGNLFICTEVSAHGISLMDPFTPRSAFLTAEDYWRAPFDVALDFRRLVEYLVLDIVMITPDDPPPSKDSCCLAHAHIVPVSDLGKGDSHHKLMVRTHLGLLLKPGDYALGYDVGGAGDPAMEVILVRKAWHVKKKRKTTSSREPGDGIRKDEYEELLRELEENTRLGLIISSPHQIRKMLPTSSDGGKWLGDEAAMERLPSTQLSSHQQESIPSVKDEPSSAPKSAPLKGAASADSKTGLVPSAVPVTEEEVKSVLLATAPMRLRDLVADFKRIKSQKDKMAFAAVLRNSKLQKTNGKYYVVPKDNQESKPSVKDEPSSASKSAPLKGAASADSETGLVPSAVPVTEEEVKSVLLATAPVRSRDLVADFKGRIKSQKDKENFQTTEDERQILCSAER